MASTVDTVTLFTEHAGMDAMAAALTGPILAALGKAINDRGEAVFAVSGGSTPKALYKSLAAADLDWAKVSIVLVDERWVDPGEAGSNESFLRANLMTGKVAAGQLVGLKAAGETPIDGLAAVAERLTSVSFPPDVVILGMGEDGHTASWFPRAEGLDGALAENGPLVAAVRAKQTAVTGELTDRITLTRSALAGAGLSLLLLAGEGKKAALERALADGPVADMPVRALLRSSADQPEIHWTR